jgi:3-hydroxyacyl-CoA dehydrogenase
MSAPQWPRAVAVLGAGVMGVQIAALIAATGRRVYLLDIPAVDGATARVERALETARQSRPAIFYTAAMAGAIVPGSLDELSLAPDVDWVIEAVVEDLEIKRTLLARLDDGRADGPLISSNTSGLSIAALAAGRSPAFARRFMGIHFFNPLRYMKLVELVACIETDSALFARARTYLQEDLGKGVVAANDTPNFIGNRLGVMAIMALLHQMEREQLKVEEVDALSGKLMARPTSATLRLCDLIGLDTLARVAGTAHRELGNDPWREQFAVPAFVEQMLEAGLIGAKCGAGFYRKSESGILVLDLDTMDYREAVAVDLGALKDLRGSAPERVQGLWDDGGRWGQLGREHLSEVLVYAAWHAAEIAGDIADIDRAMRWGFNWELGPFELWDVLGVDTVNAVAGATEPALIREVRASPEHCFYAHTGADKTAYSIARGLHLSVEVDPGEMELVALDPARALRRNEEAYIVDAGAEVGALVFCGKMNALGPAALEIVQWTVAEAPFKGVIACGAGQNFSAGADLRHIAHFIERADWGGLERFLSDFQQAVSALRSASFPFLAAVRGLSLGGGCEFAMAAAQRMVAVETRMGLVEAGVGLVPAGGGITELASRTNTQRLLEDFAAIFTASFSDNAFAARAAGLLRAEDVILLAGDRLFARARQAITKMTAETYKPPQAEPIEALGDGGIARIETQLAERADRGELSEHDVLIGRSIARVLCGGAGASRRIARQDFLDLERAAFLELCQTEATRARIDHMLATGKRLKN